MYMNKFKNSNNNDSDDDDLDTTTIKSINNNIYFYSPVNNKSALELNMLIENKSCELLTLSIKNNIDPIPIYLHINSEGGEVNAALSVVDTISKCKVPIISIIEGCVASAATLISICCTERHINPNSTMLIHQISGGIWGKMSEFEDEMKNMKLVTKIIKKIYNKYTNISDDKLTRIFKKDIYWGSKVCLIYNLVDKILS